MYVNLTDLFHAVAESAVLALLHQAQTNNGEPTDEEFTIHVGLLCKIDLVLQDISPIVVEIVGDEDYVKHSLFDIS